MRYWYKDFAFVIVINSIVKGKETVKCKSTFRVSSRMTADAYGDLFQIIFKVYVANASRNKNKILFSFDSKPKILTLLLFNNSKINKQKVLIRMSGKVRFIKNFFLVNFIIDIITFWRHQSKQSRCFLLS